MADTGHIVIEGFKAGAIKYVTLEGFVPNPGGSSLNPNLADLGFGLNSIKRVLLMGFTTGTTPPTSSGAFYIFGDTVVA